MTERYWSSAKTPFTLVATPRNKSDKAIGKIRKAAAARTAAIR
jgi:hypothetical protein